MLIGTVLGVFVTIHVIGVHGLRIPGSNWLTSQLRKLAPLLKNHMDHMGSLQGKLGANVKVPNELSKNHNSIGSSGYPPNNGDGNSAQRTLYSLDSSEKNGNLNNNEGDTLKDFEERGTVEYPKRHHHPENVINELEDAFDDIDLSALAGRKSKRKCHDSKDGAGIQDILDAIDRIDSSEEPTGFGEGVPSVTKEGRPGELGVKEGNNGIAPLPPPRLDTQPLYSTPLPNMNPMNCSSPQKKEPGRLSGGNSASMPSDRNRNPENIPNTYPWNGVPGQLGIMDENYGIPLPPPYDTQPPYDTHPSYSTPESYINPKNRSCHKEKPQRLSGENRAYLPTDRHGIPENIPNLYPWNGAPGQLGVMDGNYGNEPPPSFKPQLLYSTSMPNVNPMNSSPKKRVPGRLSGENAAFVPTGKLGISENIPNTYPGNGAAGQVGVMDRNYNIQVFPRYATHPPYGTQPPMLYTNPMISSPQNREQGRLSGGNSAFMPTDGHGNHENVLNTHLWNGAPGQIGVMDGNYGIQPPPLYDTQPPYSTPMPYINPKNRSSHKGKPQRLSRENGAFVHTDRHGNPENVPNTYPWNGAPGQLGVMDGNYGIEPPPSFETQPPYSMSMPNINPMNSSPKKRVPGRLSGENATFVPTGKLGIPENIPNTYPGNGAAGQVGVMDRNYNIQVFPRYATYPPYGTQPPMLYTNPMNSSPQNREQGRLSGGNSAFMPTDGHGNHENVLNTHLWNGAPGQIGVMDGNYGIQPPPLYDTQPPYSTPMPYINPKNRSSHKGKPQRLSRENGAFVHTDRHGNPENVPNTYPWNGAPGQLGVMDGNYGIEPPPSFETQPPYSMSMPNINPMNSSPKKRVPGKLSGENGAFVHTDRHGNPENLPNTYPWNGAPGQLGVMDGNYGIEPPPSFKTQLLYSTSMPNINPMNSSPKKRVPGRLSGENATFVPTGKLGIPENIPNTYPGNGAAGQVGVMDRNYNIQVFPRYATHPPYGTQPPMLYTNPMNSSPQNREQGRLSGGNSAFMPTDGHGNHENVLNTHLWNGAPGQIGVMDGNYGIQPPPLYDTQPPYSTPMPYINPKNRSSHKGKPQRLSGENGAFVHTDRHGNPENVPNPYLWNGAPGQIGVMDGNYGIQPLPLYNTQPPYSTSMPKINPFNSSPMKQVLGRLSGENGAFVPTDKLGIPENIPNTYPGNGAAGQVRVMDRNYNIQVFPRYATHPRYGTQPLYSIPMPYINPMNSSPQNLGPGKLSGGNGAFMPIDRHGNPENVPNTDLRNEAPWQIGVIDGNYGIQPPPMYDTQPPYSTPMPYINPMNSSPKKQGSGGNGAFMPTDRHGNPENVPNTYLWSGAPGQQGLMDGNYYSQPSLPYDTLPPYSTPMTYKYSWDRSPQNGEPQWLSGGTSALLPAHKYGNVENMSIPYPRNGAPGYVGVIDGNNGIQPPPPYSTPVPFINPRNISPHKLAPQWWPMGTFGGFTYFKPGGKHHFEYDKGGFKTPPPYASIPPNSTPLPYTDSNHFPRLKNGIFDFVNKFLLPNPKYDNLENMPNCGSGTGEQGDGSNLNRFPPIWDQSIHMPPFPKGIDKNDDFAPLGDFSFGAGEEAGKLKVWDGNVGFNPLHKSRGIFRRYVSPEGNHHLTQYITHAKDVSDQVGNLMPFDDFPSMDQGELGNTSPFHRFGSIGGFSPSSNKKVDFRFGTGFSMNPVDSLGFDEQMPDLSMEDTRGFDDHMLDFEMGDNNGIDINEPTLDGNYMEVGPDLNVSSIKFHSKSFNEKSTVMDPSLFDLNNAEPELLVSVNRKRKMKYSVTKY